MSSLECPPSAYYLYFYILFYFIFCLFRAAPAACGGSQARGQIGAVAIGLRHSHNNTGLEQSLEFTPQLKAMLCP